MRVDGARSGDRRLAIALGAVCVAALVGCSTAAPAATSGPEAASGGPTTPAATEPAASAPSASASAGSDDDDRATPITDPAVLEAWDPMQLANAPVVVWGDGFRTVRVFSAGSSSPECQPTGDDAEIEGDRLDLDFDEPEGEGDCPADLAVIGWEFTLPTAGSAEIMTARIDGLTADGELTVDIQPAG